MLDQNSSWLHFRLYLQIFYIMYSIKSIVPMKDKQICIYFLHVFIYVYS